MTSHIVKPWMSIVPGNNCEDPFQCSWILSRPKRAKEKEKTMERAKERTVARGSRQADLTKSQQQGKPQDRRRRNAKSLNAWAGQWEECGQISGTNSSNNLMEIEHYHAIRNSYGQAGYISLRTDAMNLRNQRVGF
eukprot:409666-Amphidinium_carterae.2